MKIHFKAFLLSLLMLAGLSQVVWASRYSNTYDLTAFPVVVTQAIDQVWGRVELARGKLFAGTVANSGTPIGQTTASVAYNADYPFYWVDISKGITDKHRALGFMDVIVTMYIVEFPTNNFTNWWRFNGDGDTRGDTDIRAMGDGVIYELLDYRYHGRNINAIGNSTTSSIIVFSNATTTSTSGKSGEYGILRMEIPRGKLSSYNLFLGKGIVALTGNGPNNPASGTANAYSYQVAAYTGGLSNTLIPIVEIISPSADALYDYIYDPVSKVKLAPNKHVKVPNGVPLTFSAKNSYNTTGSSVSKYMFDVGKGLGYQNGQSDGSITVSYATNGIYFVSAALTAGSVSATNNAIMYNSLGFWGCAETGTVPNGTVVMGYPDYNPSGLPIVLEVVDPPNDLKLGYPRPNPFVIGENDRVNIDFEVQGKTDGTSVIKVPVRVAVYSLNGNLVKNLVSENYPPGFWSAAWDGKNKNGGYVGEGIYYAVLESGTKKFVTKIHVFRLN